MQMKNLFLTIYALLGISAVMPCLSASAQSINLSLRDSNGDLTGVKVTDGLTMELEEECFIIQSSKSDVRIEIPGLQSFSYEADYSGIESNPILTTPAVSVGEGYIKITSPEVGEFFYRIYDLTGAVVAENRFSGETTVELTGYGKGVYLLQVDNIPAIKFIVR